MKRRAKYAAAILATASLLVLILLTPAIVDWLFHRDEFDFKGNERMKDPVKARKKWDKLPDNLDKVKTGG